jgi:hypothetical protein
MKRLSILLLLLLLSDIAFAEQWLCVPEQVMGLDSKGEWKMANVSNPINWVVVVKEHSSNSSASISYVVREAGGPTKFLCETQHTGLTQFECYDPELHDQFRLNKNTNIYSRTGLLGDLVGETNNYTPLIELGKCSLL